MQKSSPSPEVPTSRNRSRPFTRAAFWGALITFVIWGGILIIRAQSGMSAVNATSLEAAEAHWRRTSCQDYDLEIEISERQKRHLRIEVRNSRITGLWRNHQQVDEYRGYRTWTIEGMFHTIRSDIARQTQIRNEERDHSLTSLNVRARFHPTYGFPESYIRVEHRNQGNNPEISWKVISFHIKE